MKMKLYYGAIVLLWLLTSCSNFTNNVTPLKRIGTNSNYSGFYSLQINGHEYVYSYYQLAHSGECAKCKHELDSIVRKAVKEVLECQ